MSLLATDINFILQTLVLVATAMILIWISYTDIRYRLIKNEASLLVIGLFIISSILSLLSGADAFAVIVTPIVVASVVFAVMLGLFALDYLGGGDAKFITAFALITGQAYIMEFILYMAVAGGVISLMMMTMYRLNNSQPTPQVTDHSDRRKFRPEMMGDLYLASVALGPDSSSSGDLKSTQSESADQAAQPKVPYGVAISLSGFWVIIQQFGQLNGG